MFSERPLSFKRASNRQTLYPYPDSPALGEQDRRSMSTAGGALPRRETYRSGIFTLPKTGEHVSKIRDEEGSEDERDPAQIEAAYLNLVGGDGARGTISRNMSSELEFGTVPDEIDGLSGFPTSPDDLKKRTQYFEEQFQYKDSRLGSVRERIEKDSPVVAELRTNVIVKDEFTLVTDMSYNLSQRYSRPESSIMINVEHSACLLLAGSFEPAYILTISALPSQLQPVTNKRNSALIQSFMADILSVPPERGILRFQPIPEQHLAINGTTIFGEIQRVEKSSNEHEITAANAIKKKSWTKGSRKSVHAKKPTVKGIDEAPSTPSQQQQQTTHAPTTNHSRRPSGNQSQSAVSLTSHPGPAYTNGATPPVQIQETPPSQDRRKSNLNGILKNVANSPRPGTGSTAALRPPPIPKNTSPNPKISKRKSIIAIFKR